MPISRIRALDYVAQLATRRDILRFTSFDLSDTPLASRREGNSNPSRPFTPSVTSLVPSALGCPYPFGPYRRFRCITDLSAQVSGVAPNEPQLSGNDDIEWLQLNDLEHQEKHFL